MGYRNVKPDLENSSTILEGRIVDGKGQPFKDLRVIASKRGQKIKIDDYNSCEAIADSSGTFRLEKLFPRSDYVLLFDGGDWDFEIPAMKMGREGETWIMEKPITIPAMIFKNVSVFIDTQTAMMWTRDPVWTNFELAIASVVNELKIKSLGGCTDWRLPTTEELERIRIFAASLFPPLVRRRGFVWSSSRAQGNYQSVFDFNSGETSAMHATSTAWVLAVCPMTQ